MKRKPLILVLAMLLVLSLMLASCTPKAPAVETPAAETPAAQTEKVLRVSLANEPPDIDPQIGTDLISIQIGGHVLEGLVRVYDGKILPGMAESWEISEDGLTYTFHLRDAKWSDGIAVTAKDFEYSWQRLLDPDTAGGYAEVMGFLIKNGEKYYKNEITDKTQLGVKAIDDKTLEVKLEAPTGYFLRVVGFLPFLPSREDLVTKYAKSFASDPDKMAFNGPFIIKEWKHEESLTLVKNPNYWNKDKIKLDILELPIIGDSKTAINMFEAGDLISSSIPADLIETYKQKGTAKFMQNGGEFHIQFNLVDKQVGKILSNVNFRQAISYSIDRENLTNAVIKAGTPATRYIPAIIAGNEKGYTEANPLDALPLKADQAKAKEYFALALKDLNLTVDKFPTIKLLGADTESARKVCEAIQDMVVKSIGINLELVNVPSKQRFQLVKQGDFNMVYSNWFPDYDDPMTYLDIWLSYSTFNSAHWNNKDFDAAIEIAKTTPDFKLREEKMFEAEKIFLADIPAIPLYWGNNAYVVSDDVINYMRSLVGADPDLIYTDLK